MRKKTKRQKQINKLKKKSTSLVVKEIRTKRYSILTLKIGRHFYTVITSSDNDVARQAVPCIVDGRIKWYDPLCGNLVTLMTISKVHTT